MSFYESSFKIELKMDRKAQKFWGYYGEGEFWFRRNDAGLYKTMTYVVKEFFNALTFLDGEGVAFANPRNFGYNDWGYNPSAPEGGIPVSIEGKKGPSNEFPRGYLKKHHRIGGRKSDNKAYIASDAPYTAFIINGGVTPRGGEVPPNNYPERVLNEGVGGGWNLESYRENLTVGLLEYYNLYDYL